MTILIKKSLWRPHDDACSYKRLRANHFTIKNFWYWKTWWIWLTSLTLPPNQNIVSRNGNDVIAMYKNFSIYESVVTTTARHIKCISTDNTPLRLTACKFINKNDTLAYTELSENTKPKVVENIVSTDLFDIHIENEKIPYILREKNHCNSWGIMSQNPWLMIVNNDGDEIMGASYSYTAGLYDALLYVHTTDEKADLLLAILVYYVCEAEFYRQTG